MKNILSLIFIVIMAVCYAAAVWSQCSGGTCYRTATVGQTVPKDVLSAPPIEIIRKTIGSVSDESARKYDDFGKYVASRRADAITGKGFEALFALDFNDEGRDTVLIPTACFGKPTDPADLALVDRKTGKIIRLYQCKIGLAAAIKAANDPKYAQFKILVPEDVFRLLSSDGDEETRQIISDGKIVFSVDGYPTGTRSDYEERSLDYLSSEFEKKKSK